MRLILTVIILSVLSFESFSQADKRIVVLHTNDMHSRVTGFSPESGYSPLTINDDITVGGFARIASVIKQEKEKSPANTLVIDAGDFLMGTLYHTVEAETGFQLSLMKKMGYDIVCIGNHEFDFGTATLAKIAGSAVKRGEIPEILLSNIIFSKNDSGDDSLEELYKREIMKRLLILTRDGIKIGFFSLLGINAAEVAPYSAPATFEKQSVYAAKAVKVLQSENCNLIVCLSHSGLVKDKKGNWAGEDVDLAKRVKGINLVISGHTHTKLDKPLIVNGIPIVQAGELGKFVGKLVLAINNGEVKVESYELIPVDDKIKGDTQINSIIEQQKPVITDRILKPLGLTYDQAIAETSEPVMCDEQGNLDLSNLGPLVADAIHYYINKHSPKGADISMVSAGVIRDNMLPGIQTAPDIFRVLPLGSGKDNVPGYPFSRLFVTGRELKNILEILLIAYKSNSDYYCFYSGMKAEYNPDKGFLKKVSKLEIVKSGVENISVDFSKKNKRLYSITANSYMLEFISIIKKKSLGLVNVVPKNAEGLRVTDMKTAYVDIDENVPGLQEGKEWLALLEFMKQMKDRNGNGIPDLDIKYNIPIRSIIPVK